MNIKSHILASSVIGSGLYFYTRSVTAAACCFFSGFLLDLDHIPDYWANHGIGFKPGHFFYVFREKPFKRIFVLLHAWEWVAVLLIISWQTNWNPVFTGLLAGVGGHMFFDQVFNAHSLFAYFIAYRAFAGFDGSKFHGPEEYTRRRPHG